MGESVTINIDNLEQSKNLVIKNNYWNDDHEKILLLLHNYANKLYKKYHTSYQWYRRKLQYYRIPIIIMSSFAGFLSISNSGYIPLEYNKWVSLLVGFSNLLVTVISLIENFKKIDTNTNKSYISYINFKKLHNELSIVLRIPSNERQDNGNTTVLAFFDKFEAILNESPVLNEEVIDYLEFKDVKHKLGKITNYNISQLLESTSTDSDPDLSRDNSLASNDELTQSHSKNITNINNIKNDNKIQYATKEKVNITISD
jgi:hypothetical protein